MKADGIEYDERMELLEQVSHPQPLGDLLAAAYEMYRKGHPWIADHALAPKSVVRDMWERAMSFTEFVAFYGLARAEGLVLRYLADCYRTLRQTVPPTSRTEEFEDIVDWLGELIRQTDSSLLDEWESLLRAGGDVVMKPTHPLDEQPPPVTANTRAFRVLVRNALFRRVELAAAGDWATLVELDPDVDWAAALTPYFTERRDPDRRERARSAPARGRRAAEQMDRPADLGRSGRRPRTGVLGRGRLGERRRRGGGRGRDRSEPALGPPVIPL